MKRFAAAAAIAAFASVACAAGPAAPAVPASPAPAAAVQPAGPLTADQAKALLQKYLETDVSRVSKAPFGGFWEVIVGDKLFYADPQATILFYGDVFDLVNKKNVTEDRRQQLMAERIASLPFENAIKVVHGDGSRRLVIFSDSNCTYCKILEASLEGVDNVTIYTFLVPALGPDSMRGERNIWCSKDRAKAWTDWMVRGTPPVKAADSCDSSVLERNARLAHSLGLTGTPVMFFANGMQAPGSIPKAQIEAMLAVAAAPRAR